MKELFTDLIGLHETAQTIRAGQISARTVVVFLIAIVLLRLSGRRTFASNSALEMPLLLCGENICSFGYANKKSTNRQR